MIVMNDCLTCVASFSDHLLSMYVLKFSRQQRKSDRITSKVIKLFSKDLICLRPLQWENLSHVRFTYPSKFWFDSALILCGQTADLVFVAKPSVSQQIISTHLSNTTCAAVSATNQRLLRTLHDRAWKDQRSHDAMNEWSARPKAQLLQQRISAHLTKTSCTAVSATN